MRHNTASLMFAEAIEIYRSPNRAQLRGARLCAHRGGRAPRDVASPPTASRCGSSRRIRNGPASICCITNRSAAGPRRPAAGRAAALRPRLGRQRRLRAGAAGRGVGDQPGPRAPGCLRGRRTQCRTGAAGAVVAGLDRVDFASGSRPTSPPTSAPGPGSAIWPDGCWGPALRGRWWCWVRVSPTGRSAAGRRRSPSVGASTAVFTALGLLAAYSWRERHLMAQRPAQRYGPLFAGVILLGWLGTSGEHTDVMAHLLGFAVGGDSRRRDRRRAPAAPVAATASVGRGCRGVGRRWDSPGSAHSPPVPRSPAH